MKVAMGCVSCVVEEKDASSDGKNPYTLQAFILPRPYSSQTSNNDHKFSIRTCRRNVARSELGACISGALRVSTTQRKMNTILRETCGSDNSRKGVLLCFTATYLPCPANN